MTTRSLLLSAAAVLALLPAAAQAQDTVTVYSYRQAFLMDPLFEAFEASTGIDVQVVEASDGLIERLDLEGENTPADVVLTVGINQLVALVDAGLTQSVVDETINARIPEQLRDEDGQWFALTQRARIIATSLERVEDGAITGYEDLANPQWEGQICTRSGTHPYQLGLVASMIAHDGEEAATEWLTALHGNLARQPQGNDRAQARGIAEGECNVAIMNHYYYGAMLDDPEQRAWAESLRVIFPNQDDGRGTHVNVSGMVMTAHAPNPEGAVALMRFLTSPEAQELYAAQNNEYPVVAGTPLSPVLEQLGPFEREDISLMEIGRAIPTAVQITNSIGYNE